jgi:RimJ/RimL family protein N-acetyltransferase
VDGVELRTERLRLRRWDDRDREPFGELNADPVVMEYFPAALSRADSDAFVDRIEACFEQHRFGLWAASLIESGEFIGYIGLRSAKGDGEAAVGEVPRA